MVVDIDHGVVDGRFFTSHHFVKIDKTMRVTVPSDFISILGVASGVGHVWVLPGTDGLRVLPDGEWSRYLVRLNAACKDNQGLKLKQFIIARTCRCEFDAQNRIRLTAELMKMGKLELGEVAFTGAGTEMFIQDAAAWRSASSVESLADMLELEDLLLNRSVL